MTEVKTAIVVGGGIAGPAAAVALRMAGITATVYEAYPRTADTRTGGTLALAPNGLAALRVVGADEALKACAMPIARQVMAVGDKRLDLPGLADVPPLQLVHRRDLYRVLRDRAIAEGVAIEYGKRLAEVQESGTGITATFTDGSTAQADILIGADGVHSTVRRLIDPNAPGPDYTGLLSFEAVARHEPDVEPNTMTFAFGKRAYYLYWLEPGGGTRWGVNLPQERPMSSTEARAIPATEWMRRLRSVYGEDHPGRDLLLTSEPDEMQIAGSLHIMPPVPHWYRSRMVLVGDAAHAPSNSSGQGASLALESAIQVARCLRDMPDIPSAFAIFERLRRRRVEKIAAQAAKVNHAKAPNAVMKAVMPVAMRLMMRTVMKPEKLLGPVQRYVIDWDAPVTADPALR